MPTPKGSLGCFSRAPRPHLHASVGRREPIAGGRPLWRPPLGLGVFGIYSLVVAAMGTDYLYTGGGAHYLSPFYSPDLKSFGLRPAVLVRASSCSGSRSGFRATCYYYRKAYYRAFFLSPPACAVAGPRRSSYRGEAGLPFILQNVHRYFLYLATIVLGFLWYDAVRAFFFRAGGRLARVRRRARVARAARERGAALGVHVRLQLAPPPRRRQARLLHVLGSGAHAAPALASASGVLNAPAHGVGVDQPRLRSRLTDLYIRLAAAGVFHDPRIF